eukprot:scaffold31610_cov23-Cyclotella_meneghiniana.AAC.1
MLNDSNDSGEGATIGAAARAEEWIQRHVSILPGQCLPEVYGAAVTVQYFVWSIFTGASFIPTLLCLVCFKRASCDVVYI